MRFEATVSINHKIKIMKKVKLFAFAIILLQSCTVYHNSSVSLEEAVDKGKVKVITNYGSTFEFNKIEQKGSVYYGVGQNDTIQINSNDLSQIQVADTRKSMDFKNRAFITGGFTPHLPLPYGAGFYGSYGNVNINYERQFNKHLSGRLSYGTSFKSSSFTEEFQDEGFSDAKRSFYMTTLCFTTHKNNSHLEANIGYALISVASYIGEAWDESTGTFFGYFTQESEVVQSPVIEVGYRLTMGPFIFRNGVSWPFGRYMSIGYAF